MAKKKARNRSSYKHRKVKNLTSEVASLNKEANRILFVLDEDPIKAARSLVHKHLLTHARMIAESLTFKYLIDRDLLAEATIKNYYKFKPQPFVYKTPFNINFFSEMYLEIARIYRESTKLYLPEVHRFDKNEILHNYKIATFPRSTKDYLDLPDYAHDIKRRKALAKYNILGMDNPSNSPIDIQRLMYIVNGYPIQQFPCGAPEWYSPMCREVYRKYDRLSKKTFIIEVDSSGKYRYFFQHISDHKRELTDISELRELIDSLLYKS